jgi:lipid II:glycine glycyltransferase (peptidoglycan interpeptide bridge formation enzyme)
MDGEEIVAGAMVHYRSLPAGLSALAYVPMGPVVDWEDGELTLALLEYVEETVRRRRAFCLKVEPATFNSPTEVERLVGYGFQPSAQTVQPKSTILIDLDCPEDEIMARFHKKHRQKLRRAARLGVTVRPGTSADVSSFTDILGETADRKDFDAYPAEYYQTAFDLFDSQGQAQLLLASYDETVLAGIMVFTIGPRAYCMFAASRDVHRKLMPTYLLHWEGIRWARNQGCAVYDYCGIPDEVVADSEEHAHSKRTDGLWGVYRFKRGFGGEVASFVGSHDQVYQPALYSLYGQALAWIQERWGETWHRKLFSG